MTRIRRRFSDQPTSGIDELQKPLEAPDFRSAWRQGSRAISTLEGANTAPGSGFPPVAPTGSPGTFIQERDER
jgi:hypothetical protein